MDLTKKKCVPCEGGTKPFDKSEIATYMSYLKLLWELDEKKGNPSASSGRIFQIRKQFEFKDFKEAMKFVNSVAEIAESEGHHPDIKISYNKVKITLSTHAIGGLSVNDFIVARKIEELV